MRISCQYFGWSGSKSIGSPSSELVTPWRTIVCYQYDLDEEVLSCVFFCHCTKLTCQLTSLYYLLWVLFIISRWSVLQKGYSFWVSCTPPLEQIFLGSKHLGMVPGYPHFESEGHEIFFLKKLGGKKGYIDVLCVWKSFCSGFGATETIPPTRQIIDYCLRIQ